MLCVHIGEEHPQRVPLSGAYVPQQTAAPHKAKPHPPALQTPPSPAQQGRAPDLLLQQGANKELFHHVSPSSRKRNAFLLFARVGWGGLREGEVMTFDDPFLSLHLCCSSSILTPHLQTHSSLRQRAAAIVQGFCLLHILMLKYRLISLYMNCILY